MRLPLSSSLNSLADSEDGISKQLMIAGTNAEFNRISCCDFEDDSDGTRSPVTPTRRSLKSINFDPNVRVRFIRPRSNTLRSSFSDLSASFRCLDSPVAGDSTQLLKEASPQSDDEEFDRFYRTMDLHRCQIPTPPSRSRRFSLDQVHELNVDDIHSPRLGGRTRSVSCDDFVFQTMNIGGAP